LHPTAGRTPTKQRVDDDARGTSHLRLALVGALTLFFVLALGSRALALQQKVTTGGALLGFSTAVDGDTLAVGDPSDGKGKGAVLVFQRVGDTWIQNAKLTASDGSSGDVLGESVAIQGNTIVAGAPSDTIGTNVSQGSVYTFARDGAAERTETAKLIAAAGAAGEKLGSSVAIEGDTIVASAPEETVGAHARQGAVFTFAREGAATRTPTAELTVAEGGEEELLGTSVAEDGPTIVAGAARDTVRGRTNEGAVYTFDRAGSAKRTETARLLASDGAAGDELGVSVSISGETIVAGAPFHTVGANKQQGAGYTFARTGAPGRFQTSRLIDPEGAAEGLFGFSVATDGSTTVAGAPLEGSASIFFAPAPPAVSAPPPAAPPVPPPPFAGSPPPPPPPPATAALSRLNISPRVLRLRLHTPRLSKVRRGVQIGFALSAPSRVALSFAKVEQGRRAGTGACQPQDASNRRRARCVRLVGVGSLSVEGHSGSNAVPFTGRLSRDARLTAGSYIVSARTVVAGRATGPAQMAKLNVVG